MMEGMQFTLGPTMAFRRDAIHCMGGFRVTSDYCADDFVLGNETWKLGQTVVLSHHPIDHMVINSSFLQSMKHQVRWMKSTRFSRPKGHFGTALTFSLPFGLLGLAVAAAMGHWGAGLVLLAWSVATRLALSIAVGNWVVRDRNWFGLLVLYPIRDLMGFCFWAASYLSSRILWRGRVFQLLPGGKMRAAK
jgi:ceramide glucosyltransferase